MKALGSTHRSISAAISRDLSGDNMKVIPSPTSSPSFDHRLSTFSMLVSMKVTPQYSGVSSEGSGHSLSTCNEMGQVRFAHFAQILRNKRMRDA